MKKYILSGLTILVLFSCNSINKKPETSDKSNLDVQVIGALKNVMWKGEVKGIIHLDTIKNKKGLYGLGPVEYLKGELLVVDGKSYVSYVDTDSTMTIKETFNVSAPFFVYTNVTEWHAIYLTEDIVTKSDLENYLNQLVKKNNKPFAFKLIGHVRSADIHIQNLPDGIEVNSPEEAHQGQQNYMLEDSEIEIVGFYSTSHKGIFTHHDSNVHMHLISADRLKMGHLDNVTFGSSTMKLYLPKN